MQTCNSGSKREKNDRHREKSTEERAEVDETH